LGDALRPSIGGNPPTGGTMHYASQSNKARDRIVDVQVRKLERQQKIERDRQEHELRMVRMAAAK
jgi:hypothetical protein